MKKLYTLQECFEALGSKFPFTVDWYNRESKITLTFVEKKENIRYDNTDNIAQYLWRVKNGTWSPHYFDNTDTKIAHLGYSLLEQYDWKTAKYKIDFEELLK